MNYRKKLFVATGCTSGKIYKCYGASAHSVLSRYSLPPARKEALSGMGIYFEELPLLASCAFTHVCEAARDGSGVASSNYIPFAAWMGDGRPLADAIWINVA